ncbi:CobW family GTP-binding protein [Aspergillus aculeatinus CBS 121060]|uniref:CobW domain protein n=1 Tax=Aspergillus aculeatinus CBS 121060 TaxID=1448322 RepID=A0ACD1GUV5_9EURO|nr:CobW domain protein [Aspergillus aculeatinus CBS 121060]RAH65056.1 CobW domain protein [Aspergillus aculeatinus CBS 121060]
MDDEDAPPQLVDVSQLPESAPSTSEDTPEAQARVPITLVTGYLGAGKTTLLNYILTEKHGKKIAVIMNEFGDSTDIEKPLTVNQDGQEVTEWMEVGNGCICCSVKDSGVMAIESLMARRGTFDYILLETTGLADPGNIAPIFWVDDNLGSSIYLDGIVTLVDAKNILHLLDEPTPEETVSSHTTTTTTTTSQKHDHHHHPANTPILSMAHMQISHADVIILNKADLVTSQELARVRDRIVAINSAARIHVTDHSQTPRIEGVVLDLHAYDHLDDAAVDFAQKGHSHIDPAISTIALTTPRITPAQVPLVDEWLRSVLWDSKLPGIAGREAPATTKMDFDIHRLKGILAIEDGTTRIIQAVRDVFEIRDAEPAEDSKTRCKIVLIGRGLGADALPWQRNFEEYLKRDRK